MKKILLVMIMMLMSVYANQASAFSFSDLFGGGGDDNSAVGAGIDDTNYNGTGPSTDYNGTGPDTNYNGTGPSTDFSATGDNTPAIFTAPAPGTDNNPYNSNKNPFSSGSKGVPKLSLMGIVSWLIGLMNQLVYLIIGAALVSFLYGILKLSFVDGHKPEAREQARKFMFWGIVSLFVMMSVWGLVNILKLSLFGPGDLIIPRLK